MNAILLGRCRPLLMPLMLLIVCLWAAPVSHAEETDAPSPVVYKSVDLGELVIRSRSPQRIILAPYPVEFSARVTDLPRPQKTDYLKSALNMMQITALPPVSKAILLGYGQAGNADNTLPVYITDEAAQRVSEQLKPGDTTQFFGLHVYNYSKGPALVITDIATAKPR